MYGSSLSCQRCPMMLVLMTCVVAYDLSICFGQLCCLLHDLCFLRLHCVVDAPWSFCFKLQRVVSLLFPFLGFCFLEICLPGSVTWCNGTSSPYNPFKWPLSVNTWLFSVLNKKSSDTMKIHPIFVLLGLKKFLDMAYSPLGSALAVITHLHRWSWSPRSNSDDPFQAPLLYWS